MAELLLKVGDQPVADGEVGYLDGDVICAYNDTLIGLFQAERICAPKHAGFTAEGLRADGLAREYLERMRQYRYTRVSMTEYERLDLLGQRSDVEVYSSSYLDDWIHRQTQRPYHAYFGTRGAEVWYGGRLATDEASVAAVWAEHIEVNSPHTRFDNRFWLAGTESLKWHLAVSVDDFSDEEREELESSVIDDSDPDNPRVEHKRRYHAERGAFPISPDTSAKIEDRGVSVDVRGDDKVNRRDEVLTDRGKGGGKGKGRGHGART